MYDINLFAEKMSDRISDSANRDKVIKQIDEKLGLTDLWSYSCESFNSEYNIYRCEMTFDTDIYISLKEMRKIIDLYKEEGYRATIFGAVNCSYELPGYGLQFQVFIKIYKNGTVEVVSI